MEPDYIRWNCRKCGEKMEIPAGMGDQIFKCPICKAFYKYRFHTVEINKIEPPERRTTSGCRIY